MLETAQLCRNYSQLEENQRREILLQALRDPRPLRVVGHIYGESTVKELAVFEAAREGLQGYGRHALRHYIISHTEEVSDLLEVLVMQKETGLMQGRLGAHNCKAALKAACP